MIGAFSRAITAWLDLAVDTAEYQRRQVWFATAFNVRPTDTMRWQDGRGLPESSRQVEILRWLGAHK